MQRVKIGTFFTIMGYILFIIYLVFFIIGLIQATFSPEGIDNSNVCMTLLFLVASLVIIGIARMIFGKEYSKVHSLGSIAITLLMGAGFLFFESIAFNPLPPIPIAMAILLRMILSALYIWMAIFLIKGIFLYFFRRKKYMKMIDNSSEMHKI